MGASENGGTSNLDDDGMGDSGEDNGLEDELDNLEGDLDDKMEDDLEHNLEDKAIDSEDKEDDMDNFIEASGYEPKAEEDIHRWMELRDQIKTELEAAHQQHAPLLHLNKYLVLLNFATL